MTKSINLTREQLFDLVWSEPLLKLSQHMRISDVAIAKHCKRAGIPVPARGYWNKLYAGKPVTKSTVPERDLGTINRISMSGVFPSELRVRIQGEPGVADPQQDSIEILTDRFRKRLGIVTVPRGFSTMHPAIAMLLRKADEYQVKAENGPFSWPPPKFADPLERRLRVINGLFLAFSKVGGSGWIRGTEARELAVSIGEKNLGFTLECCGDRGRRGRRGSRVAKAARLHLELTHSKAPEGLVVRWQDRDDLALEDQLAEIVVGMAVAAEHFRRQWIAVPKGSETIC